jgi:membrane protease YdiL (CAAX protease family)
MKPLSGMRPLGVLGSGALFVVPAAILYATHYFLIPAFVSSKGVPYLVGYLIGWPLTMALFLLAALLGYMLEGNPMRRGSLASRFRMTGMQGRDWAWALGLFVVSIALYFGLGFTSDWLARVPWLAPHPVAPTDFGPQAATARIPGFLMGMPLVGKWWVAMVFIVGWLLNIFGEEMWFRGYLLPRQELAMGARAWIANGLMFSFNHIWQPWNLLLILPSALLGAYIVQKRRNTWILILMHGLMNLTLVVTVVLNVAGVAV